MPVLVWWERCRWISIESGKQIFKFNQLKWNADWDLFVDSLSIAKNRRYHEKFEKQTSWLA